MEQNNILHETGGSGCKDAKRQQFTNKQRMDMYAFCVLELEMHSNKVSIKKQQQAIQKVLYENKKESQKLEDHNHNNQQQQSLNPPNNLTNNHVDANPIQPQQAISLTGITQLTNDHQTTIDVTPPTTTTICEPQQQQQISIVIQQNGDSSHQQMNHIQEQSTQQQYNIHHTQQQSKDNNNCNESVTEGKTLLQLQQEVAMTRKCYSDYQKTQVLTSSMLRDVQKRFSKYYPDAAIPSRSTIKHVFEKCVTHGTVENIRTPRKATKIPQGDEIEYLLIHEPQMSLRQLAQKLNVSTGTVSRRCKALGLVPESVTIKHQQLATARRQKQIKQLENQNKSTVTIASTSSNDYQ